MHNPVGFSSLRSFSDVENEGLFDADFSSFSRDDLVGAGGFPVAGAGDSIGPRPVRVFSVSWAEKVPFFLSE